MFKSRKQLDIPDKYLPDTITKFDDSVNVDEKLSHSEKSINISKSLVLSLKHMATLIPSGEKIDRNANKSLPEILQVLPASHPSNSTFISLDEIIPGPCETPTVFSIAGDEYFNSSSYRQFKRRVSSLASVLEDNNCQEKDYLKSPSCFDYVWEFFNSLCYSNSEEIYSTHQDLSEKNILYWHKNNQEFSLQSQTGCDYVIITPRPP